MKLDLGIKEVKIIQEDENNVPQNVWLFGTPEVNEIIEQEIKDGATEYHLTVDSSAQWTDLVNAINETIVSMEKAVKVEITNL